MPPGTPIEISSRRRDGLWRQLPSRRSRALQLGDGWIPIGKSPDELAPLISDYRARAAEAGKPEPEVITFSPLNGDNLPEAQATLNAFERAGVSRLVWLCRYRDAADCQRMLDKLQLLWSA